MRNKRQPREAEPGKAIERMVVMGRIAGPYGVSGWVRVFPYTEDLNGLLDYPIWWLGGGNGDWLKFEVAAGEVHGSILVALLDQYTDREAAAQLKGLQIAVPRSQLPVLSGNGKDGYYWTDLVGLEVVNLQGEELGKVAGLLETGANDVLQVQNPKDETARLIPFIDQVIVNVNFTAGRITVDWGLDY